MSKPARSSRSRNETHQPVRQQQHVEEQRADGRDAEHAEAARPGWRTMLRHAKRRALSIYRRMSASAPRRSSVHDAATLAATPSGTARSDRLRDDARRDAQEDQRGVVPPLEEPVERALRSEREAECRTQYPPPRSARPSASTCSRMRRRVKPMRRSVPTVSRRSSTIMIISASRKTALPIIVTMAIARWKRSITTNVLVRSFGAVVDAAVVPGTRAEMSRANAAASEGLTRATLMALTVSGRARCRRVPGQRQQIR